MGQVINGVVCDEEGIPTLGVLELEPTDADLADNPTKAQELAHWREFVAALPAGSYLAMYLQGADGIIEHAMAQDMPCVPIAELRDRRDEATADLDDLHKRIGKALEDEKTARHAAATARMQLARVRDDLEDVARTARTLTNMAETAHGLAAKTAAFGSGAR